MRFILRTIESAEKEGSVNLSILKDAAIQDRKRLLELFPISSLKEAWPDIKGTKEEICFGVAGEKAGPAEVIKFIQVHFGRCKQHVYIFDREAGTTLPEEIVGGERVETDADSAFYIVRTTYSVLLKDPLEEADLDFLWPIKIELTKQHLIVRFVAMEKNVSSYFDRNCFVVRKSIEEKTVLKDVTLPPADIHQGIKKLWNNGFMDSPRTKFKKPKSLAMEAMDEEMGIRENYPELYEVLQDSVLLNTLFLIPEDKGCDVSAFLADCSHGYLAFPRYSEGPKDTNFVISEIVGQNQ
jgi:hypothetical protein